MDAEIRALFEANLAGLPLPKNRYTKAMRSLQKRHFTPFRSLLQEACEQTEREKPPPLPRKPHKPYKTRCDIGVKRALPKPPIPPIAPPVETQMKNEKGQLSRLTMPISPMTPTQFNRELKQEPRANPLGFSALLNSRDLTDLKFALSADDSPKAQRFLEELSALPANSTRTITDVALECGIGLMDLMRVFRNDRLLLAMATRHDGNPILAAHTVQDAQRTKICCSRCDGAGTVQVAREKGPVWITCPHCDGEGATYKPGDHRARHDVFEATGILKAGPGIQISIDNRTHSMGSVLDEIERVERAPSTPAIDVESSSDPSA